MNRTIRVFASLLAAAALEPLGARALPQFPHEPWELTPTYGRITDSARALPLPPHVTLRAVFDWDRDGQAELFGSRVEHVAEDACEYHLLVLRSGPGRQTRVERDYAVRAECGPFPDGFVTFYVPPVPRQPIRATFSTAGGAKWFATVDVVEPGFERPVRLFARVTNFQFVDFDGSGVYQAVGWSDRPADERCAFGMFGMRTSAEILVHGRSGFQPAWPPNARRWRQLITQISDLDADGNPEVASLEDNGTVEGDATALTDYRQRLAVYTWKGSSFSEVANAAIPSTRTAFWLAAAKQGRLQVSTASPEKCAEGGVPEGEGTSVLTYALRNGALQRIE